jgi:hypothetical protein
VWKVRQASISALVTPAKAGARFVYPIALTDTSGAHRVPALPPLGLDISGIPLRGGRAEFKACKVAAIACPELDPGRAGRSALKNSQALISSHRKVFPSPLA